MKQTIPSLLLKFSACIIVISQLSANTSKENFPALNSVKETPGISEILSVPSYDSAGNYFHADTSAITVIIFKTNRSCSQCFTELSQFLTELRGKKSTHPFRIQLLSRTDSTSLARRRETAHNRMLFPVADQSIFCYKTGARSLFDLFESYYSPEVLVVHHSGSLHLSYGELYDVSGNLSAAARLKIAATLN